MKEIKWNLFIILLFSLIMIASIPAAAAPAPDRSQQILDVLTVESQKLYAYAESAQSGDVSAYEVVKAEFSIAVNNVSLLLDESGSEFENQLRTALQNLGSDASSAQNAAAVCDRVRSDIYRELEQQSASEQEPVATYEDCVAAGYHTDNGTCFIGGTQVYDPAGNLIGYYYADCYDANGFHPGSCWDCFYGADNAGCLAKP